MPHIKVEILLPLKDNQKKDIDVDKYDTTYQELEDKFCGYTVDSSPLLGDWKDPDTGEVNKENNFGVWVVCENIEDNKTFWREYKELLKQRFQQKSIMMYYTDIYYL